MKPYVCPWFTWGAYIVAHANSCPRSQLPTQTLAHANTCPPVPLMQTGLPDSDTMSAKQPPALGCHDLHV